MTRCTNSILRITAALVVMGSMTAISLAVNRTPGTGNGDHTAFYFGPLVWHGFNDLPPYQKHVCSGGGKGQQYDISIYQDGTAPNPSPTTCTVASFYDIIHNNDLSLATLLIDSHGHNNKIAVEVFAYSPAGKTARDARYAAYIAGTVPGCPAFLPTQIGMAVDNGLSFYCIYVTNAFITAHANLPNALIFNSHCFGATLNDDWTGAGARVSLGWDIEIDYAVAHSGVTKFFSRMDGQEGITKRPVSAARAGIANLAAAGAENTTLAPAVIGVQAPCPIYPGDWVTYTLDTECWEAFPGNIVGTAPVVIENEIWTSPTTLKGQCTQSLPGGAYIYGLTLKWGTVWSKWNAAMLDGNTVPPINAKGRAHDDHKTPIVCIPWFNCSGDYDSSGYVDIGDLLYILDNWENTGIDALLATLDNWGSDCPLGACCLDLMCLQESLDEDSCVEAGGEYLGDGSECGAATCNLGGACCFPPYDCADDFPEETCIESGGQFYGPGSTCAGLNCWTEPLGACCHADGTCMPAVTESDCMSDGDVFAGPDSDCEACEHSHLPIGACCLDDGMCVEMDEASCMGLYLGDSIACDEVECEPIPTGACCLPDGSCVDGLLEYECINNDGVTHHPGQACDEVECEPIPTGACCTPFGCLVADPIICEMKGGAYQGNGTTCDPDPCSGECPPGEIEDCYGNCAPSSWLGDGYCDDGTYQWNGVPIYFNCDQFNCDGGDCSGDNCF